MNASTRNHFTPSSRLLDIPIRGIAAKPAKLSFQRVSLIRPVAPSPNLLISSLSSAILIQLNYHRARHARRFIVRLNCEQERSRSRGRNFSISSTPLLRCLGRARGLAIVDLEGTDTPKAAYGRWAGYASTLIG